MYRILSLSALFVALVLLQVFLFDNLSISIYLNPLVYVAFIILLPLTTPHIVVLLLGFALGVTMDCVMGAAGENTIATLFIAFLRPTILNSLLNREGAREEGVPSAQRLGLRVFLTYVIIMVFLHHLIFFSLEALSWSHILHTAARVVVSSIASVLFIWIVARIFTAKLPVRV